MRYFIPPLEIGDNEGFTSDKDIFGRKAVGDGLTNLLSASTDPLVLAVNGQWGSGKTVFLKMWAGALRNAGYPVVNFDAFEHDYLGDAFTAIAGEILMLVKKARGEDEFSAGFVDAAKKVGKVLLRAGVIYAVKACTAGAVDAKGAAEAIEDAAGDAADKILEEVLTSRESDRGKMNAFQATLSELPALLGKEVLDEKGNPKPPKPLIFIIDELDRCRPTFALEVLERIKHFFSVPNVHFVLGVNIEQLENSIKAAYGADIAATTYLQKFIALTVELDAQPGIDPYSDNRTKYIRYLKNRMDAKGNENDVLEMVCHEINLIALKKSASLRTLERIMSLVGITAAYNKNATNQVFSVTAGLCIMKVLEPDLYRKAKSGRLAYSEVKDFFGFSEPHADDSREWAWFMDAWRYCLDKTADDDFLTKSRNLGFKFGFGAERNEIVSITANELIDRFVMGK